MIRHKNKFECPFCHKLISMSKQMYHWNKCKCDKTKYSVYDFLCGIHSKSSVDKHLQLYQDGYAIDELKVTLGVSREGFELLLNAKNIHIRTQAESTKTTVRNEKCKKTSIKKYGVSNPSMSQEIKNKKAKTFIEHYGYDNVRKCPDFREKHGYNDTMLALYGKLSIPNRYGNKTKWWKQFSKEERKKMISPANRGWIKFWQNLPEEEKVKIIEKRLKTFLEKHPNGLPITSSLLETRIENICQKFQLKYKRQIFLTMTTVNECDKKISRHSYDFLFGKKSILEIQGDYWHCNPTIYKADDIVKFPFGTVFAYEIWDQDLKRKTTAEKMGYKVSYLWESEMNHMSDEEIYGFIINKVCNASE